MCRASALYEQDFSTVEWSLCPCFMCGPRSTSVLGLRILQSYVPLRAGRCESLPHMKYRTGGDISQLLLNPAFIYNRSSGYLIKPQFVCKKNINKRVLICVTCGNGSFEYRIKLSKTLIHI